MSKYRKKPVVIDAFLLGADKEPEWFKEAVANGIVEIRRYQTNLKEHRTYFIRTLEGNMAAREEIDYIIRGVNGELYPCKADIFEKTYEEVTDDE